MPDIPKQIRCKEHGYAPWGFVCVHLATGESREWQRAPQEPGSECEDDWLCPECAAKAEPGDQSLRLICVHCIQALRRRFDPKFTES